MDIPSKRLLLADNSTDYRKSLLPWLRLEGYEAIQSDSVAGAIAALRVQRPDLALVDLRLTDDNDENDLSGLQVAKTARDMGIPCIVITAFPSVEVTRLALRARGEEPLAVDFVTKAAGPEALLDAIRAVLTGGSTNRAQDDDELIVDTEHRLVRRGQEVIDLSDLQYKLLRVLAGKPGAVVSAAEIMKEVYDEPMQDDLARQDKRLQRLVERTRERIEPDASNPRYLLTDRGRGYRLMRKPG